MKKRLTESNKWLNASEPFIESNEPFLILMIL